MTEEYSCKAVPRLSGARKKCGQSAEYTCFGCDKPVCAKHTFECSNCGKNYCLECMSPHQGICKQCNLTRKF